MRNFCLALEGILLFLSITLATPVAAQYTPIPNHAHRNIPVPSAPYSILRRLSQEKKTSETRFSWWGYCHDQLHKLELTDLVVKKTGGYCCSGQYRGRCRMTIVNVQARTTLVDGVLCTIPKDVKIVVIPELRQVAGCSGAVIAVVCASKASPQGSECGAVHCVAVAGGTWN